MSQVARNRFRSFTAQPPWRSRLWLAAIAILAALLVACGGGGGKPSRSSTNGTQPPVGGNPPLPGSSSGTPQPGGGVATPEGGGVVVQVPEGSAAEPEPGQSNSVSAFSQTAYPLLMTHCARCHAGQGPGSPNFAQSDVTASHDALVSTQKVVLNMPVDSRLVVRLAADFHYCWLDCAADAVAMTNAITQWATLLGITPGAPPAPKVGDILSGATSFAAATSGGTASRVNTGIIARWDFAEGSGTVARDTSGVTPALDLSFDGAVEWLADGGIDLKGGRASAPASASRKLYDRIAGGSGQYTLEAWVSPVSITQVGPARIVTYSVDISNRNFSMNQVADTYAFRNRSTAAGINSNGGPNLNSPAGSLQAALQHVVMTWDSNTGRRLYIDGAAVDVADAQGPGALSNWDASYALHFGNEPSNDRPWQGQVKFAAVYDRALAATEVRQNFEAGVGNKVVLKFDISNLVGAADSYIALEAAEFDKNSYLFAKPLFVSSASNGVRVKGIRIAVNNQVQAAGQVFSAIDMTLTAPQQPLSRQAAVIAKDQGMELDQFTLVFEILGDKQNVIVEPVPTPPVDNTVTANLPDAGIRTFEQINTTMATLTGVSTGNAAVNGTFREIRQQLPSSSDINGFLASQQVGIFKLALEYCDVMVENAPLRDALFGTNPAFEFGAAPDVAFGTQAKKDIIINGLIERMIGENLATQPSAADTQPILNSLISDLTGACTAGACDAARTRAVVKAACSTVLSSAATLIQ